MTLAILGLLASMGSVAGVRHIQRSRQVRAMDDMKDMAVTVTVSASNSGRYPAAFPLNLTDRPDPWGHPYEYSSTGDDFELRCLGRDGVRSAGITFATRDDFDLDIVMKDGQFISRPLE